MRYIRGDIFLYGYVRNNPVNFLDPWGLLEQDVEEVYQWVTEEYPELIENLEMYAYYPIDAITFGLADGLAVGDHRIIIDSYYRDNELCENEREHLYDLIVHELLHLYVNEAFGGWENYLAHNIATKGAYHDWIKQKAIEIGHWRTGLALPDTERPDLTIALEQN